MSKRYYTLVTDSEGNVIRIREKKMPKRDAAGRFAGKPRKKACPYATHCPYYLEFLNH